IKVTDNTYEVQLDNEAGLYGVLSDVSDFVQPDDSPNFTEFGNTAQQTITLGVGVTTFAVTSNVVQVTGDGGTNTIATITGAYTGIYTFIFVDGNVTISNNDNHDANSVDLDGANNFTSADDKVLQLVYNGTSWYKISESTN
ncbi:MAG: hypothetical protein H8D22_10780, partial [Candidatus Cloacimonetes bacterium]|nr:hypothetical protein [Candidatus Cloacimonadota bacterium]